MAEMVAGRITWDEEYPVYYFEVHPHDGNASASLSEKDLEDLRRVEREYYAWQTRLAHLAEMKE